MLRLIFFALMFPLSAFAGLQNEGDVCSSSTHYRAGLRHIGGGGIGYTDGYTTLELFLAPDPSQWEVIPFLDARGHIFNNGKGAANAGIGLRALCENGIYGINAYYDYRNVGRFNSNQIGLGLEALGKVLDFRINGYLPTGKKSSGPYGTAFEGFSGNNLLLSQKNQSAMKGVNAEFGFHVRGNQSLDLYAAAGPYYYNGGGSDSSWGGKASLAGTYKEVITLEISDSYDKIFRNKFQAQISVGFSFDSMSNVKEQCCACICERMVQPVRRQEIVVVDNRRKNSVAIDPLTGQPFFFVFVNNTGNSNGTYESPYHSLAQAQDNSSPNDVIYVFPGDGTTTGMDSGILLKANQKFWGSGISHALQTTQGNISIPAQSSSSPTITNTNIDTDGNAITLAANNAISGFTISSTLNDAIYGTDPQNLDVSFCKFENTNTYAIEASFLGNASISLTNNQFLNNVNGVFLSLNGTSNLVCSTNTFEGQTSVSSVPLEIAADSNVFNAQVENNVFSNNTTGSIRFNLTNVVNANIDVINNTILNNGTGSQASLGSSFTVLSNGTIDNCAVVLRDNLFTGNTSNSLYLHTSGAFTNLEITASSNNMSGNGGSALVLATPSDNLTLLATDNVITECNDNGIAVIASGPTTTGNITISNNFITDIGNASNGIAINQDFSTLNLSLLDNKIYRCEGTGIVSYAPTGIDSLTLNVRDNVINNCQNLSSNAASGLDIEQYTNFNASITGNTLTDNTGIAVVVSSTLPSPAACVTLTGNNSNTGYLLINPVDGVFNLSPCDVDSVNAGTINTSGVVTPAQSCPDAIPCPP